MDADLLKEPYEIFKTGVSGVELNSRVYIEMIRPVPFFFAFMLPSSTPMAEISIPMAGFHSYG